MNSLNRWGFSLWGFAICWRDAWEKKPVLEISFRSRGLLLTRDFMWLRPSPSMVWVFTRQPPRFSERFGFQKPLLRVMGWRLFREV